MSTMDALRFRCSVEALSAPSVLLTGITSKLVAAVFTCTEGHLVSNSFPESKHHRLGESESMNFVFELSCLDHCGTTGYQLRDRATLDRQVSSSSCSYHCTREGAA